MKKKLIEVALPLEAINKEAAREKSIRYGHPSTLHLWWARRPLAACRAVLFSSLVDDPSSHPEQFPTLEAQEAERQRLFKLIERLVKWENIGNEQLYKEAYEEILKSTCGNPPPVLDPFAGGGSIPLEAQRLGLEAHASDINPVAVLINKALIEIPPRFANMPPVNPEARASLDPNTPMKGASGLAKDVRYYGEWMKQEAFKLVGHLYPKVKTPDGKEATVIAWIWARTVKCPNPACGAEMPLVNSYWLSKKKGKEAWIKPVIDYIKKTIEFEVEMKAGGKAPEAPKVSRGAKFRCPVCGQIAPDRYIKDESIADRMGSRMMAIIAEGNNTGRFYLSPNDEQFAISNTKKPDCLTEELPYDPRNIWCVNYGLTQYRDLFTPRQLSALVTFSNLVNKAIKKAESDAILAGFPDDNVSLDNGGKGAMAYGEAVGVYLACVVDRQANYSSSLNAWSGEFIVQTFGRQALPMVWDYAESNPFSNSTGNWTGAVEWVALSIKNLPAKGKGVAFQKDAATLSIEDRLVISTDPPYYDNIAYADLSDYFYIWLRKSLGEVYPSIFSTMLVPKSEELIVNPYRFDGNRDASNDFYQTGMQRAFTCMRKTTVTNFPLTIYYAYKQNDNVIEEKTIEVSSNGWETMLNGLISAGFSITGTWPLRTERSGGFRNKDQNALASSIAIVCRPRSEDAPSTTRRDFLSELREALKKGLHDLQSGNIAPVDLAQASIGPGMAVYSKYSEVLEADGTPMSVHDALVLINQELDAYFSAQEGSMDTESRFCIAWYEQYGLAADKYGYADTLARAKMAHLQELVDDGVLESGRGNVRLKRRDELPEKWDSLNEKTIWTIVQQLCHTLETQGIDITAQHMLNLSMSNTDKIESAKALAYRAYITAERRGWADEALAYNSLVSAWPDLVERMTKLRDISPEQMRLDF